MGNSRISSLLVLIFIAIAGSEFNSVVLAENIDPVVRHRVQPVIASLNSLIRLLLRWVPIGWRHPQPTQWRPFSLHC